MFGLSNKQIVFIYFSLKAVNDRYDDVLGKGQITQMILGMGPAMISTSLGDEILDDLRQSEHYEMLKSTVDVLQPIFELIQDVEPELVKEVEKIFE